METAEKSERRAIIADRRMCVAHRLRERVRVTRHGFPETLEMKGRGRTVIKPTPPRRGALLHFTLAVDIILCLDT